MSSENTSKINQLLRSQPAGVVMQSSWLAKQGYSLDLQKRYKKSNWLKSIGTGAMIRAGDHVSYEGAIYSLQQEGGSAVHPGGKTALGLLGMSHYLEFAPQSVTVFGGKTESLPKWFKKYDWGTKVNYYKTSFLPPDMCLTEKEFKSFAIKISNAPRALMECLYLVPEKQDLVECFHLMESMNNVRPTLVQELLEKCESIKVKRLFLYLAEKTNHDWFKRLNLEKVELGRGKRSVVTNGVYNSKYQITVSRELEENDQRRI